MKEELKKKCTVDGCGNVLHCRGYCKKHWKKLYCEVNVNYRPAESHGLTKSEEYSVWSQIKQRCYSENYQHKQYYQGKDLKVSKEWRASFLTFLSDMGKRPSKSHQIDRIDNTKGYSKDNCRWVLPIVNIHNRSNTKLSLDEYDEIKDLYKTGNYTQKEIGIMYDVGDSHICQIITGKFGVNYIK